VSNLVTPDDSCTCGLCGNETSLAMIAHHLVEAHGFDSEELSEGIADAPIYDATDPRDDQPAA
jgi:hypothetical protein